MPNKEKEEWAEDSFGLKDPIDLVSFVFTKCKQIDGVPKYYYW